ncbi:hypothetical protein, partial [Streptomyces violaceorubidus]|uniref:hypothetical protein n=1 Tax=Streptomyces violaceorubidus TaxID=284042 RepID=UPI001ADFEDFF
MTSGECPGSGAVAQQESGDPGGLFAEGFSSLPGREPAVSTLYVLGCRSPSRGQTPGRFGHRSLLVGCNECVVGVRQRVDDRDGIVQLRLRLRLRL